MKNKFFLIATVLGVGILAGSVLSTSADGVASGGSPGSADDPVVTKSYVDQQIQKALNGGLPVSNNGNEGQGSESGQTGDAGQSASKELQIVDVKVGEKLIAKAGTEFIVRAGKAVVHSPDENGISDLTDGKDIKNGQAVTNNHLLLFPRDGRGVMPDPGQKNGLTVMVRGNYEIQ
ncbi:hypothetical protein [Paenibacillus sp. MSJ-34]|uniref:hypothetical protein n=1 Tax=Paenibacillus sp. MSJ-34 TaxID=2841529 RepID=UPI001C128BD6|nr:hypothetical protein [Paenibacillus sp. MSJ-34]MBU5440962.1 hypothetical protein [Paenibacillus sp. MSJ-34]